MGAYTQRCFFLPRPIGLRCLRSCKIRLGAMRQIDDFAHALIVRVPEFVHASYSYSFCPRLFANVVVKSLCAALYVYLKQYTIRHESYRVLEQAAGCVFSLKFTVTV